MDDLQKIINKSNLEATLLVKYGEKIVTSGEELTTCNTITKPQIYLPEEGLYTLLMIDPDVPPGHMSKAFIHWLVTDIKDGKVDSGKEVLKYFRPTPPKNSGIHRYFFLLFKQEKTENEIMQVNRRNTNQFEIFLSKNLFNKKNLVAKTYFIAKFDEKC